MSVFNVHERVLMADAGRVGALIDTLGSHEDLLWPHRDWPPMTFDRPLSPGAMGNHGPVRYTVTAYVPATWVRFTFRAPHGFGGFHEFTALPLDEERTVLRHTLAMNVRRTARLTWPLAWRPLHDACLEDSLDRAELACTGAVERPARRSPYTRLLRGLVHGLS
ncbi:SRPBCC family protein [Streptomyces sp. NPDC052396]|uniref:SRPBCC family protein n=1 Tax=Streptomyces sp. NPDC052396 TaxID=3365689 RepID=UPI0037CD2D7A